MTFTNSFVNMCEWFSGFCRGRDELAVIAVAMTLLVGLVFIPGIIGYGIFSLTDSANPYLGFQIMAFSGVAFIAVSAIRIAWENMYR